MPRRAIVVLKAVLHLLLLLPVLFVLQQFHSGALAQEPDPVNSLTHLTGNVALWILLGDLAITPLRRLSPRLAFLVRFRRLVGLYAFFYATLHLLVYVFLFSGFDLPGAFAAARAGHPGVFAEEARQVWPVILDDIRKRRFIQVGFAAWVLLLLLAATSPTAVLRAIGGKPWQRIHRLVYVAAVLAVVHFWWLVKSGVGTPWKDTAVLAVLLLARVLYAVWKRRTPPRVPGVPRAVADV